MNKLWRLYITDNATKVIGGLYEASYGFVVCAHSEVRAREIASSKARREIEKGVWLDPTMTTCEELSTEKEGIVIEDYVIGWPG